MDHARSGLKKWLWEQRTSTRTAYLLHISKRIVSSFISLFWMRLIVDAMGKNLFSVFLAFQNVFSFGGVGDLGIGGAVGIRSGQYLGAGKGKEPEFLQFLSSARAMFLCLGLAIGCAAITLSPWLPTWFQFPSAKGAGSLQMGFVIGSLLMMSVVFNSYISNLNYACGNMTWPVLPMLLTLQCGLCGHWLLARAHAPLWMQLIPYVGVWMGDLFCIWFYVRVSHPHLARLLPIRFDWPIITSLFESSFWVYLCSVGNTIYRTADGLVINAGARRGHFALDTLAGYQTNYKLCDFVVFVALTASFVSLPKITQWMASTDPKDGERVRLEMQRLNQFQSLLGCGAALAYLLGNNLFMRVWWWHSKEAIPPADFMVQTAFALNMAVTACGDAGIQLAIRSGKRGLRVAGGAIGLTGLLNVALSIVAMKLNWLAGIAFATVIAQSILSMIAGYYICRHLRVAWLPWAFKGWLLPLVCIGLGAWLRMRCPMDSIGHIIGLVGGYVVLLVIVTLTLGINFSLIKDEFKIVRKFLPK